MGDLYDMIFKRKSFHLFRGRKDNITEQELKDINNFIESVVPLIPDIKTAAYIVPESETTCRRGAEYCILLYSEHKENYLQNIGYIGEQIDLYLTSKNIGALWFGIGKPEKSQIDGIDFVIMIAIAKMPCDKFRKDMHKSKRKPLGEIWSGDTLDIANIVRFAPSACNTQPWIVENSDGLLKIYRYKKPDKRGIMPVDKVMYYNRIDVGIFLYFIELCLHHNGVSFERKLFDDNTDDTIEKTLAAEYKI